MVQLIFFFSFLAMISSWFRASKIDLVTVVSKRCSVFGAVIGLRQPWSLSLGPAAAIWLTVKPNTMFGAAVPA